MPHSIQSRKNTIDSAHNDYISELFDETNSNTVVLNQFCDLWDEIKIAPPSIVTSRFNIFLKDYPVLCDRIVGFHPNGKFKLTDTEFIMQKIPVSSPIAYIPTRDILASIVPHLNYTTLGRLAKTCKWVNANITGGDVEKALEKAREWFGRVQFFNERRVMRVFNIDREPIEFGQIRPGSTIKFLRTLTDGRTYMGYSQTYPFTHEERAAVGSENYGASSMWYEIVRQANGTLLSSGHNLVVRFLIRRDYGDDDAGGGVTATTTTAVHSLCFDEFLPLVAMGS